MEHKTFLGLFFVILVSLVLSTFVFAASYDFAIAGSITCGNGFCEFMSIQFDAIGKEEQASIAGETYTFKIVNVVEKGGEKASVILSVNGEEVTIETEGEESNSQEMVEKFGFMVDAAGIPRGKLTVDVYEAYVDGCAVPDCDSRLELDVHKKWNLVPLLFLSEPSGKVRLEGTCKLHDFLVIYGYNPAKNNYSKFHTYGKTDNDLKNALRGEFGEQGLLDGGIVAGTGWNSVWVYSLSECKLAAEAPKKGLNLLSEIAELKDQGMQVSFASGWNFWTASKDMEGKSFDEINGDCEIEKAYSFEAQSQSWKKLGAPPAMATNFLFKVKDACMFEAETAEEPEEPELPSAPALPE